MQKERGIFTISVNPSLYKILKRYCKDNGISEQEYVYGAVAGRIANDSKEYEKGKA